MIPDSTLAAYVCESPNRSVRRSKIDHIIIHCMAGNLSVESCGRLFADPARRASSHYGIGTDGRIAQYVPEAYRAWTTGGSMSVNGFTGADMDHRAITIEVANNSLAPLWLVSPEAMDSLIKLCADICKRNGIPKLLWHNDKALVGQVYKQNMALHRWFANKSCPGPFLIMCMGEIAKSVNVLLEEREGFFINGVDYSPVFDPTFYVSNYADLREAFGYDEDKLWEHFCNMGMNELRQAKETFDPCVYMNENPDVAEAYGEDYPMYYYHYCVFGKDEHRKSC